MSILACKRDPMVRDRDETETFDFQFETRSRPRPSHVSTRSRRDRDVWKLRLETVSRPRRRDRDYIPATYLSRFKSGSIYETGILLMFTFWVFGVKCLYVQCRRQITVCCCVYWRLLHLSRTMWWEVGTTTTMKTLTRPLTPRNENRHHAKVPKCVAY